MSHFQLQIQSSGPIISVVVGVSAPRIAALQSAGQSVPPQQTIRALVDTGASCTCVDPSVISKLGLSPTGTIQMMTPSTGATPHQTNQYDVSLIIPPGLNGQAPHVVGLVAVTETVLSFQGIDALIGRDILQDCILIYNGSTGFFTLAF